MIADEDYLRIGDYVLWKSVKFDNYLCSDGILSDSLSVNNCEGGMLDDFMFCIHFQRQYSAAAEYADFLESQANSKPSATSSKLNMKTVARALQRGKDNETALNDEYMATKLGEPLSFGSIIQLFHIKSQKYLTVIPGKLADGERENLKIGLDVQGNAFSWIELSPRFKIDKDGDPVLTNTEVFLKFLERPSEYIHVADLKPVGDRLREVNCSLESTAWKLNIFQSSLDYKLSLDPVKKMVLGTQVVYINDPETKCNMTVATSGVATLLESHNVDESGNEIINDEAEKGEAESPYHHEYGDIVLEPSGDVIGSRLLWSIETKAQLKGGPIRWRSETVRFKHVNSGLYLMMLTDTPVVDREGSRTSEYALTTTSDSSQPGTLFNIEDLVVTSKTLSFDKPMRIGKDGIWIERGEVLENLSYVARGCTETDRAISFKLYKVGSDVSADEESAVTTKEPLEVFTGLSIKWYLNRFLSMCQRPASVYVSTIWPTADRADLEMYSKLMSRALYFSQGFPISATDIILGVDRAPTFMRQRRQKLFRDQGILEVLLRMIDGLQYLSLKTDNGPQLGKSRVRYTEEEQMLARMGKGVLEKCFNLLLWLVKDNPENQMYVADHMPVLLAHLGGQPLAGQCVTEMLASNMELQETKIGTREIAIFVDKLRSSKMNSMYLQLLKACCSCQGNGIDNNQCKVTELLFSNTNDVIIQMHADSLRVVPCDWRLDDLYLPSAPIAGSPVNAESLLYVGLPTLSLAWTTNSIDFSPLGLFGKLSVSVEELYRRSAPQLSSLVVSDPNKKSSTNARKNVSLEQKASVAKYFINQMFLCAEMCMDRNYVAMHTVDSMFPYDTLISILRLDVNDNLKSAAARLLLCLHVDRDPQAETKIPCFTRTWSETQKSADSEPRLPFVEAGRRFAYGLLQQIVSDHVKSMTGRHWTEYSTHVLQLLKQMVAFNFYGTNERMRDVIGPLIKAIDRRSVSAVVDVGGGSQVGFGGGSVSKLEIKDVEGSVAVAGPEETAQEGANDNSLASGGDAYDWQRRSLDVMEGLPVMIFILVLVLASVAGSVYETISGASSNIGTPLFIFYVIIDFVFVCEIAFRAYCYVLVRGTLLSFLINAFNIIDMLVIAIDIVFFAMPPSISSKGKFTKVIRLVRLIRLLRIARAARVITSVAERNKKVTSLTEYVIPLRYSKCPQHELDTMVQAVEILQKCQSVIEDRNLTLLLKYFYLWECEKDTRSPGEIFEQVIHDSQELSLGIEDFDGVFVDVLMFTSTPLVQSSLEILMSHHSARKTLLDNATQIQLLVSAKRERQYKIVDQMLQQLEQNAETHELWGELQSEADRAVNKQTKDIVVELTDICRVKRSVLEFDEEYMADTEIQNLFRNLGCFKICFKVLGLLDSVEEHEDEEGNLDEVGANTQELCRLVNSLLYWFLVGNAQNQELGYLELEFFMESLEASINSHRCIRAIFKGNERLMKMVSHGHIKDMTELICKGEPEERSPYFLSLMLAITHVDDKGMRENQVEIMKQLTSPGRAEKIACFLVPLSDPEYAMKVELMAPFLDRKDVNIDELPPLVAYHLNLLELFSGCTVGRIGGITSIEAKAQAVFNYEWAMLALLDPNSILIAKIRLGQFIFNAVIEVEMMITGLENTAVVWQLLKSFDETITTAKEDIIAAQTLGWGHADVSRQRIEYHVVCMQVIGGFFSKYFDYSSFKVDDKAAAAALLPGALPSKNVRISSADLKALISSMLSKVAAVSLLDSPILSALHKGQIAEAVVALQKNVGGKESSSTVHNVTLLSNSPGKSNTGEMEEEQDEANMTLEQRITKKYGEFLAALQADESVQLKIKEQGEEFIRVLEAIPFLTDDVESDIRQETLFRKLVTHVRENITIVNNERRLTAECTKTTIWVIQAFRTMLENRMGMSIYERDDDGGAEQDEKCAPVVAALCACGATTLCIDLISVGIDPELQLEAMKLGVGLLFKEGGAIEVQTLLNTHLSTTQSDYFFKQVHLSIQKLIDWHRWRDVIILGDGEEPTLPEELILIRFLQLMSEGHYLPNQDIMREQPNNPLNFNLLDDLVGYLACLSRLHCQTSTNASIRVAATILEVIQGPCKENQFHFTMKTELLETLNRIMRSKVVLDCTLDEEVELKKTAVDIFQGLLEGQALKSTVYERLLSVIHLDIILQLSDSIKEDPDTIDMPATKSEPAIELTEDEESLKTECLVLLQMLCDCKPAIRDEFGLSKDIEDILKTGTSVIEVVWNGDLQRRFFHVPGICEDIAKSSMDAIVENVDRSNLENQLIDFVDQARSIYREIKHQQQLRALGLSSIFNKNYQDKTSWFSFFLSCLINLMLLVTMTARPGQAEVNGDVVYGINALIYLQIIVSFFVLLSSLVIRSPVVYQTLESDGETGFKLWLNTATDPMTLYYMWFFLFTFLGAFVNYYYLAFLLLDICMKNATTRAVLSAVTTPRQQLFWAMILCIIAIYIFSFYTFSKYPTAFDASIEDACESLFGCFKMSIYSIQSGGGISDFMDADFTSRVVMTICFYLFVMTILINVVFGIIIDTFGSLREEKDQRQEQTVNFCFVCGIDKQTFDRAAVDSSDGFRRHIRVDHCMWNYLKFVIFIWEQDRDDDDGLEQFVRRCVDSSDVSWMPLSKAIKLNQAESEEDRLHRESRLVINNAQLSLQTKIDNFQGDLYGHLLSLTESLIRASSNNESDEGSSLLKSMSKLASLAEDGAEVASIGPSITGSIALSESAF